MSTYLKFMVNMPDFDQKEINRCTTQRSKRLDLLFRQII